MIIRSSREYEPMYTVKNLYNDFMILQDVFLTWKVRFLHFMWNLVLLSSNQVPHKEPHYTTSARDFALNVRRHLDQSVGRR